MIVVAGLVALLLVGAAVLLTGGALVPRRSELTLVGGLAAAGAVVGVLLFVAGGLAVFGVDGEGDDSGASVAPVTPSTSEASGSTATTRDTPAVGTTVVSRPDEAPIIVVEADRHIPGLVVPAEPTVRAIELAGFEESVPVSLQQCTVVDGDFTGCREDVEIRTTGSGAARFPLLLDARPCTLRDPACIVWVRAAANGQQTVVRVLSEEPPEARLSLSATRVRRGDALVVAIDDLVGFDAVDVAVCNPRSCGRPVTAVLAGGDGEATLEVGGECGVDETTCHVVVRSDEAFMLGGLAEFDVVSDRALGPSASYDPSRLVGGLVAAAALLVLAAVVVRTTDWRRPDEPEGPWTPDELAEPADRPA